MHHRYISTIFHDYQLICSNCESNLLPFNKPNGLCPTTGSFDGPSNTGPFAGSSAFRNSQESDGTSSASVVNRYYGTLDSLVHAIPDEIHAHVEHPYFDGELAPIPPTEALPLIPIIGRDDNDPLGLCVFHAAVPT